VFKDSPFCVFNLTASDVVSHETSKYCFIKKRFLKFFQVHTMNLLYFRFIVLLLFLNETNESVTHETLFLRGHASFFNLLFGTIFAIYFSLWVIPQR